MITVLLLVTLIDGSTVHLQVDPNSSITFSTEYGTMIVPIGKMRDCSVGSHANDAEMIAKMIKSLGNDKYASRAEATKWLEKYLRHAYPQLVTYKGEDLEVKKRIEMVLKDSPKYQLADKMMMANGAVDGQIQDTYIRGVSSSLGELKIPIYEIANLRVRMQQQTVRINAGEKPVEIGYVTGEIKIRASGEVDLYPPTPGQYVSHPAGFAMQVNGYPAGALLGRINGHTFLVGHDFWAANMTGTLELFINGPPDAWQPPVPPEGSYTVDIK